jgi:ADP-ribose pyrophosphatase
MRIAKVEKLTNEKWINLFATNYEYKGHQGRWVFASRRPEPYKSSAAGDAVIIVPILRVGGQPPRLVLEKEFRVPVGDYVIGLPAGLLEPGESIEDTVRRELLEETGLEVTTFKRVTQPLLSSSGLTDEAAAMAFVDAQPSAQGGQALEGTEDIEVLLLDFAAACRLCDAHRARIDAKAWSVLYLYQQLGQFT